MGECFITRRGGTGGAYAYNVSGLSCASMDDTALISWSDPRDGGWRGTRLVRKKGGYPKNQWDGVTLIDLVDRDGCLQSGYSDRGLEDGVTYYYTAFPYSEEGVCVNEVNRTMAAVEYVYPPALTGFMAAAGIEGATLTFSVDPQVTRCDIVYKAGACPENEEDGAALSGVSGMFVGGLEPGVEYFFRAFLRNGYGRLNSAQEGNVATATPAVCVEVGVAYDPSATTTTLTRLGHAQGLSAVAGVGDAACISGFDTLPVYKDIRLCNLSPQGTVNAYKGDGGFALDGTNGDVMVEIPKFWYKTVVFEGTEQWRIAQAPKAGYAVHPAFDRGDGAEHSHLYLSAYETAAGYFSKTGGTVLTGITRAEARTNAMAKGAGWFQLDVATVMAVNLLLYIEYADLDVQRAVGEGLSGYSPGGYTTPTVTGKADAIAGHTGRAAGTSDKTAVKWRGIENWWGNSEKWVDGINLKDGEYYYCLNPANFADDTAEGYTAAGYSVPTDIFDEYVSALGYHEGQPWLRLPAAGGGTGQTGFCDGLWTDASWRVLGFGGSKIGGDMCGIAAWSMDGDSALTAPLMTCRLVCLP